MHLDVGERCAQRLDAGVVRPVAAPDDERSLVEPEHVAALCRGGRLQTCEHVDSGGGEVALDRVDLDLSQLLAGSEQNRAAARHGGGVVDVDRVERRVERLADDDLCARGLERRDERLVLLDDAHGVGCGAPAVLLPAVDRRRAAARRRGGEARSSSRERF